MKSGEKETKTKLENEERSIRRRGEDNKKDDEKRRYRIEP